MTRTMHLDFAKAILGFIGATLTLGSYKLAQAMPDGGRSLVETTGTIGLIGCLIYAVRHLNAEVRRQQDLREKDREKMEGQWKAEHEANRENREHLASALSELSTAVKDLKKS